MAATFYFQHIPDKEKYLSKRYEADWPAYQQNVKAFVPFIC
jgi:protein-S-isoprenylcysteine O-methyltransferase Ste14